MLRAYHTAIWIETPQTTAIWNSIILTLENMIYFESTPHTCCKTQLFRLNSFFSPIHALNCVPEKTYRLSRYGFDFIRAPIVFICMYLYQDLSTFPTVDCFKLESWHRSNAEKTYMALKNWSKPVHVDNMKPLQLETGTKFPSIHRKFPGAKKYFIRQSQTIVWEMILHLKIDL